MKSSFLNVSKKTTTYFTYLKRFDDKICIELFLNIFLNFWTHQFPERFEEDKDFQLACEAVTRSTIGQIPEHLLWSGCGAKRTLRTQAF